ncbi:UvrB/UvrC motif-containing protein [Fictibacillus phosphorivorans]|uniref:UvrB/UvrC motif-containing protein n=1 Tax=Fictibacillus phosphorivorans TaxID=1221500 RepID=UPI002041C0C2|nr:UvrB/UvrC motif-containing protein [Fictibacillus phosphorivorans]MCM3719721.1 UvrB/UvrC motif-containing protein [Fictibacillus phosphorivorans]MCM3777481.1 UvrB/UvrC motif-containing protein [Fictibacillus phosphorivorans]
MNCEECHEREASLHFTKIINGEKTEFHICEHCAKEKGEFLPGSNSFSIHQLLSGLLHGDGHVPNTPSSNFIPPSLACEKCGMSYYQFAKIGRFGCDHCYKAFESKLNPIFKRVHGGNTVHAGKIPLRAGNSIQEKRQLQQLKQAMQQYILNEEFEKAAETRDEIRKIEQRLQQGRDT